MKTQVIGKTTNGQEITAFEFGGNNDQLVLVIAGVHGDEVEGVVAAEALVKELQQRSPDNQVTVIPVVNVDGFKSNTRKNSRGVDLNRNLPTKDWSAEVNNERYQPGHSPNSEPENQALLGYIEEKQPGLIISLHSYKYPMLNINGDCRDVAEKIAAKVGYDIKEDIGYATPGCLGTYYGLERNIPVLTYEFLRGMDHEDIKAVHVPAILEAIT